MELKPLNSNVDNSSFNIKNETIDLKKIKPSKHKDSYKLIPDSVYSIIYAHSKNLIINISFLFLTILLSFSLVLIFALLIKTSWFPYLFPIFLLSLSLYKLILVLYEYFYFKKAVLEYRKDIEVGVTTPPQFLDKIYTNLFKRQIIHNWITFISIFYLGIFTLLIWLLKDQNWGLLEFGNWIHSAFVEPDLMTTLLAFSLVMIAIIHIFCAIQRKKQIYNINSYFGQSIISQTEVTEYKVNINKAWRRGFILSLLIILIIPILVKLILKIFHK